MDISYGANNRFFMVRYGIYVLKIGKTIRIEQIFFFLGLTALSLHFPSLSSSSDGTSPSDGVS